MRGLIIGRFQPFNLGHEYLIEQIDEQVDQIVVGIGSAGQSHTRENPLTSGERVHIVQDVLTEMDAETYLIPIFDVDRNSMWVKHVETICPTFQVAYTNNPFVEWLFPRTDTRSEAPSFTSGTDAAALRSADEC